MTAPVQGLKEQPAGLFAPVIDRTRCEGGFHHACAELGCPCVAACPHSVLEIRPLTAEDKRRLSFGERVRAWIHRNRQAYVVNPGACTACGQCVRACPVKHVIKLKRRPAGECCPGQLGTEPMTPGVGPLPA